MYLCSPYVTRWRSWLRHCATSRKVAGSIPDGVIGIFHWLYPSGRTITLEYQGYLLGGKDGRCVRPTTLPPSCAYYLKFWEPQPPGTRSACPGLYRIPLPLPIPSTSAICLHLTLASLSTVNLTLLKAIRARICLKWAQWTVKKAFRNSMCCLLLLLLKSRALQLVSCAGLLTI